MIKSLILDDVPGPLYITAWGGLSTVARALKSIQDQCENTPEWNNIREKVANKVILLPSGDQDLLSNLRLYFFHFLKKQKHP